MCLQHVMIQCRQNKDTPLWQLLSFFCIRNAYTCSWGGIWLYIIACYLVPRIGNLFFKRGYVSLALYCESLFESSILQINQWMRETPMAFSLLRTIKCLVLTQRKDDLLNHHVIQVLFTQCIIVFDLCS